MERTIALLSDSGLPKKWWAEAAFTGNYLGNFFPQWGEELSPHEALFGVRPDVSHLRVFGCKAWVHVPWEVRRKLDPRAVPGTFVG